MLAKGRSKQAFDLPLFVSVYDVIHCTVIHCWVISPSWEAVAGGISLETLAVE